jgi:peptide/nickel transport system ATP-binding protein
VVIQRGILKLISDLRDKHGTSIVLITHDISVLAEVSDKIAIMYAGKIVEAGDIRSVFEDPLHPYTQALINSVPSLREKKKLEGLSGLPPDLKRPPPGCRFSPRCPYRLEECSLKEPPSVRVKNRLVSCFLHGG